MMNMNIHNVESMTIITYTNDSITIGINSKDGWKCNFQFVLFNLDKEQIDNIVKFLPKDKNCYTSFDEEKDNGV